MRFCQSRAQPGPAARFLERFHSIVSFSWPSQLFLGWHCDPGSQSDKESGCIMGEGSAPGEFCFCPPCGASTRARLPNLPSPLLFLSQKTWKSVFNALTAMEFDSPVHRPTLSRYPGLWFRLRDALALPTSFHIPGLAPQGSGSGAVFRCGSVLEFGPASWHLLRPRFPSFSGKRP